MTLSALSVIRRLLRTWLVGFSLVLLFIRSICFVYNNNNNNNNNSNNVKNKKVIIIIIPMITFLLLSSRQSCCKSSLGLFDECRLSAGWSPPLRPSICHYSLLLLLSAKPDAHFTVAEDEKLSALFMMCRILSFLPWFFKNFVTIFGGLTWCITINIREKCKVW